MDKTRAFAEGTTGVDPAYLRQAGELGWFAMLVPEEWGGGSVSGVGLLDATVIAGERGRNLQPGPFVPTNVVADTLARDGSDDHKAQVLPLVARGESVLAWAVADMSGAWEAGRALRWAVNADGFTLSGTASLVQDAELADWILVTAGAEAGISQFLVPTDTPGLRVRRVSSVDLSRTFCHVDLEGVQLPLSAVVGLPGGAAGCVERQIQIANVLTVAEMIGAMEHNFEMALEYARARIAFGRPIGSFQAIKHLLADTSLLVEESKAVAGAAAHAVAEGTDGAELASVAKAFVSESALELGQNCFQIYAGIGFTWEHDQHFYLRRLTMDAMLYGDAAWHRARLCDVYGLQKAGL
jgi:alkylation response protein AidB-like acyl-CoA dehydrogenase